MDHSKFKIGTFDEPKGFSYKKEYQLSTTGKNRIVVTTNDRYVDLLKSLVELAAGPFWLLYVHVVSRNPAYKTGRFQSPQPLPQEQVLDFLTKYAEFLETDGRHHLWVASSVNDFQLVYDRHNLLYIYGDKGACLNFLIRGGFQLGEITIPSPHIHQYHPSHDPDHAELMREFDWVESELRPGDEE